MKQKTKVLIAEDETLFALALKKIVAGLGYNVEAPVATGDEAVRTAGIEKPQVMIMDIGLRGKIDGIEAAKKIHEKHGIPSIFITGHAAEDVIGRITHLKSPVVLPKPVSIHTIEKAIASILRERCQKLKK